MKHIAVKLAATLLVSASFVIASLAPAKADDTYENQALLDHASRAVAPTPFEQKSEPTPAIGGGIFDREKFARIGHGAWSLVVPGLAQYRSGHTGRAIAFASAEVVIWGTWTFSKLQGHYREDRYQEFAQLFAGVQSTSHDDDYWRAVGRYLTSEEFNARQRKDNRAAADEQELNGEPVTIGLNDGTIAGTDSWTWASERRATEYRNLRADAQSAFDRADFVILFALVNRIVAFADAVRSGPRDPHDDALLRAGDFELHLDVDPLAADPTASMRVGRRF